MSGGPYTASFTLNSCNSTFYSFSVPTPTPTGYLQVNTASSVDNLRVLVSDQPFTTQMLLDGASPNHVFTGTSPPCSNCLSEIEVYAICPFATTNTWYVTIENYNGPTGLASVTLNVTIFETVVTELVLGTPSPAPANNQHASTDFANSYDFYHFTHTATPQLGEILNITIANNTNSITNIFFNLGSIPAHGYDENTCAAAVSSGSTELIVDYCTWSNLLLSGGDFYIAVQSAAQGVSPYDILIQTSAPTIVPISLNQPPNKPYFLTPGVINYYSFTATSDTAQFFNASITSIQGGTVDFAIDESLPFLSCPQDPSQSTSDCNPNLSNCCLDVSATCELVIQPCRLAGTTYYIGVEPQTFNSVNVPISYQIQADITEVPDTVSLADSDFQSATLFQSHYMFYEFSANGISDTDATLNLHLYVDRTSQPGTQTFMYVNYDDVAGANTGCWSSIAECSVTDVGSCSIQLNPCLYSQHENWYVSVFGGNTTTAYGTTTDFTVLAKIAKPVDLDESYYVTKSAVYDGHLQHYQLDGSLLPSGGLATLVITDTTGGSLNVYLNYGSLAGPTKTCPVCFNNTEMRTTQVGTLIWPIANCNSTIDDEKDDIYFAIEGNTASSSASDYVGYSITVIASEGNIVPATTLHQNEVLVDSVMGRHATNYTMNGDSDHSAAYLRILLTQIDGDSALTLNVFNTTNLNCAIDSYMDQCTVDMNIGYCSIVIQNCVFNSSDGWIAQILNGNDEEVHYNIYYQIYEDDAVGLENGVSYAGAIYQNEYQQFEYTVASQDTMIIEVFFDQCISITDGDDDDSCYGTLYVSTEGAAGPSGCFVNEYTSAQSSEKAVFAITSCDLPDQTFYFSVGTTSSLYPNFPFGYTIKVTEMSSQIATTPKLPMSVQLYPRQKVYHTFSYTNAPDSGSRVVVEITNVQNGDVSTVLAQAPPPSDDSCPCFEYGTALEVDYCEATGSGEWTVMTQATGQENEQVGYIITILPFSQTPTSLDVSTASAPVAGSLHFGTYNYYTWDPTTVAPDSQLSLSVSNVVGGSVRVYMSEEDPATMNCFTSSPANCAGSITDSCVDQSCTGYPQFISVYAETTTSYEPLSYTIQLLEYIPITLQANTNVSVSQLEENFIQYFAFNSTTISTFAAPQVTFTVDASATSGAVSFWLTVYENAPCTAPANTFWCGNGNGCSISVSHCNLGSSFYLAVDNRFNELNFTVVASVMDLAASSQALQLNTPADGSLTAGAWKTYTVDVPESDTYQGVSFSYSISGDTSGDNFSTFFNMGTATPNCTVHSSLDDDSDSYTIGACCLESGTYSLAVQASDAANFTVEFSETVLIAPTTEIITTNNFTNSYILSPGENQQFSYNVSASKPYAALWAIVETNATTNIYFQQASVAGNIPGGLCATDSDSQTGSVATFIYPQCDYDNTGLLATSYQGGNFFIGVANPSLIATNEYQVNIQQGIQDFVPLTMDTRVPTTGTPYLMYYYTFNAAVSHTSSLQVKIQSNTDQVDAALYFQTPCSNALDTCDTNPPDDDDCTLDFNTCETAGEFIITVQSPPGGASWNVTATMEDFSDDIIPLTATPSNNITDSSISSATIPGDVGSEHYAELFINNFDGNVNQLVLTYTIEGVPLCGVAMPTPTCTFDDDTNLSNCVVTFDSCLLSAGSLYYFSVEVADDNDSYALSFSVSTLTSTPITLDSITNGEVGQYERASFNLTMDYTKLVPGNTVEIKMTTFCGSAKLYINQGAIAGPDCSIAEGSFTFSACDLITAPVSNYQDPNYYLSVIGESPNMDSQFIIEVDVSGPQATFLTVGVSQIVTFNGQNVIYSFPITGFNDFVGQLQLSLIGTGKPASLDISFDTPTLCHQDMTLSVNSDTMTSVWYWDACDIDPHRVIYLSFTAGSDTAASFELVHVKPFVRDLDVYTSNPQNGAVVATNGATNQIIDEEYYRISLNPTATNFRFTAWLGDDDDDMTDDDDDSTVQILSGQTNPPSSCDSTSSGIVSGSKVVWEWCDIDERDEMYMTVYNPTSGNGDSATPYSLHWETTADIEATELTPNTPLCDSIEGNGMNYYTAEVTSSPTTQYSAQVYAINGDGTLTGYITFGGLASAACASAANTKTCSDLSSGCTWEFDCPLTGNMSLAISNGGNSAISYFVVWNVINVPATALTVGTPSTVSATSGYFSLVLPTVDVTSQYLIITAESDMSTVAVQYQTGQVPGDNCFEESCSGVGSCSILIDPCGYKSGGTGYIYVSSPNTDAITVTAELVQVPSIALPLDTFMQTSLSTSTNNSVDIVSYKVTITSDMITGSIYGDMGISIYGVNQGSISVSVTYAQLGFSCAISSATVDQDGDILSVDACFFTPGDYYITATLSAADQLDSCTPVTFGIMATMAVEAGNVVALADNVAVTGDITFTDTLYYSYSYTPSSNPIVSVSFTSAAMNVESVQLIMWESAYQVATSMNQLCVDLIGTPISYFWQCNEAPSSFNIIVSPVTTNSMVLPNSTFTLNVHAMTFTNLTEESVTSKSFSSSIYQTTDFYVFSNNEAESVQIDLEVLQGPAVTLEIWDNSCGGAFNSNQVLTSFTCYSGHCLMPFSWADGDIFNSTFSYYITVSGVAPAMYNLNIKVGEENTCYEPEEGDLCDVKWTVWDYGTGETGELGQASAALRTYNQLVNAFCSCGCSEVSKACNDSLIEYACTQTYRACNDNGLQTSICEDSCADIEENCGRTFTDVGLPWLSCNHNFYYSNSDDICEDIYQITITDGTDVILYIVIVLVLLVLILLILGAVGFFVMKKVKASKAGGYEKIAEADSE